MSLLGYCFKFLIRPSFLAQRHNDLQNPILKQLGILLTPANSQPHIVNGTLARAQYRDQTCR